MNFGRLMTAMVSPFDNDLEINLKETEKLVNHLINQGTDTIVVAGTTGESPTLSNEEKILLFTKVVEFAKGRAKVIAGTGTNNTKTSIELTKRAEQTGVDGIMLVTPYYNKPSQEGLYYHFNTIANETKLPVMIYNIPSRAGINVSAETIIKLSKTSNIFSVKEASGDIVQMSEIIKNTDDDFLLYSGDDKFNLPVLAIGGYGSVSVASHVCGLEIKNMIEHFFNGETKLASQLHLKLISIFEGIFITSNPSPIKELLNQIGLNVGSVRPPLMKVSDEQALFLRNTYQKLKSN